MNEPIEFSDLVLARKERILLLAKQEARNRRLKRRALRGLGGVLILIIAAGISWRSWQRNVPAINGAPRVTFHDRPVPPTTAGEKLAIRWINTDPTIGQRLSISPEPPQWEPISDDQLFATLSQSGTSASLITIGGKENLLLQERENRLR